MDLKDKTIIIFGASSGIGEALAVELSKHNRVCTFSRRPFPKPNDNILPFQGDVTKKQDIKNAVDMCKSKWAVLDGFIYSVGQAQITDFNNFKADDVKALMDTNFFGFLNSLECVLPDLIQQKSGVIAVVSALMLNRSLPNGASYFGTKAAMHVFFEGLRMDLQNRGIEFFEIRPGLVDTPMSRSMDVKSDKMWSSERAAQYIVKQMKKNETDISFPLDLKILTQSLNVLPDSTYFKLIKSQMDKNFRNRPKLES
tara:strand:- start:80546 stop:81310 length:765 start_codon:yes stop_codon:yes gene_type:complete